MPPSQPPPPRRAGKRRAAPAAPAPAAEGGAAVETPAEGANEAGEGASDAAAETSAGDAAVEADEGAGDAPAEAGGAEGEPIVPAPWGAPEVDPSEATFEGEPGESALGGEPSEPALGGEPRVEGEGARPAFGEGRAWAGAEGAPERTSQVVREHLRGLLEALLFLSNEPMAVAQLAGLAQADRKVVRELLGELQAFYRPRGVRLDEIAGGWLFRTNPAYAPFLRELTGQKPVKMSRAQIETLAIVAYRQPVTRPEVDEIRGVDSGPVLKALLERDLVRIMGKKEEPGRPLLYGTTSQFLHFFGLNTLRELPTLREFTELTDDSKQAFTRETGEEPPAGDLVESGLAGSEGHLTPPARPGADAAPGGDARTDAAPEGDARADAAPADATAAAPEGEPAGDADELDAPPASGRQSSAAGGGADAPRRGRVRRAANAEAKGLEGADAADDDTEGAEGADAEAEGADAEGEGEGAADAAGVEVETGDGRSERGDAAAEGGDEGEGLDLDALLADVSAPDYPDGADGDGWGRP